MPADERRRDDDAVRGRVIAVIGHALRTPVTTVRGLADVLHRAGSGPPEPLEALRRETRVLENLLDDLLIATDVGTALSVQRAEEIPVGETVRAIWEDVEGDRRVLRERAEERGIETTGVDATVEDDGLVVERDGTVSCEPDALRWMLRHVLDNAAKYGGRPVRLSVRPEAGQVHVEVVTPEPACEQSDLEHAFELFYRGEQAVMAAPGLGVGLTVARRLARHARGELTLRREGDELVTDLRLPAP